jgi:hypothetical protein
MRITGDIDVDEFKRQYRLEEQKAQKAEKKKQKPIPPLDASATYFNVEEYAKLLRVSTAAVYKGCTIGAFEGAVKLGSRWRIPVRNAGCKRTTNDDDAESESF